MDLKNIFIKVQNIINDVPLLLVGTGASIPYGIPGMKGLSEYLLDTLREEYIDDPAWVNISARLESGIDLESAMTNIMPEPSQKLVADITKKTWEIITQYDLKCGETTMIEKQSDLSVLLKYLYRTSNSNINIITTNYDRLLEYSCDKAEIETNDGFEGSCHKWFSQNSFKSRDIVNIIKVHGSLDYFKNASGTTVSIPLQSKIPDGFIPDIIPPGSNKYRNVLMGIHRDLLQTADTFINNASSYMCIGYGFNDEQIQEKILCGIKAGKPILVVTKDITDNAVALISNNSNNYVIVTEDDTDKTNFNINGNVTIVEGNYWTIPGICKIVIGE